MKTAKARTGTRTQKTAGAPAGLSGPGRAPRRAHPGHQMFRAKVGVGDVITFDPTGEQLRVSKIEDDRITFEKLP